MSAPRPKKGPDPRRARRFAYERLEVDPCRHELRCHFALDDEAFSERVLFEGVAEAAWDRPGVEAAAQWVFLLLGVSYYKAGAPPVVDLGELPLTSADLQFLRTYYVEGLGEFAYRNGLDLTGIELRPEAPVRSPAEPAATPQRIVHHAMVPFGGGIDSIVTAELVRAQAGDEATALFVVSRAGDRFAAIERAAGVSGLRVLRAERELDPRILRSDELGYLNGHVPVTGMISAIAVLGALLHSRDAVVMSNESSASSGNLVVGDRLVNHQWSKGLAFEAGWRACLARHGIAVDCFSLLRPVSELWVARRFASLTRYHGAFHSCNRAFYSEPGRRLEGWCGECDKCCFVDLVLAPFMDREALREVFAGNEPLGNESLAERFRTLLGTSVAPKPFDCVGDVGECRAALRLTARRPDRGGDVLVHGLLAELPGEGGDEEELLRPGGPHFIPDAYAPGDLLV